MKNLITRITVADTQEEYESASTEILDYFAVTTDEEREIIQKTILVKADETISNALKTRLKAAALISKFGK